MGSIGEGVAVRVSVGVAEGVNVAVRVAVGIGLGENVSVGVANTVARSRLTVKTEAKANKNRNVIPPPMIQGRQLVFWGTVIFKSRGTLINTTVVLS